MPGTIEVTYEQMNTAFSIWLKLKGKHDLPSWTFWKYLGDSAKLMENNTGWLVTPRQLSRMEALSSPHAFTMIKAIQCQDR